MFGSRLLAEVYRRVYLLESLVGKRALVKVRLKFLLNYKTIVSSTKHSSRFLWVFGPISVTFKQLIRAGTRSQCPAYSF